MKHDSRIDKPRKADKTRSRTARAFSERSSHGMESAGSNASKMGAGCKHAQGGDPRSPVDDHFPGAQDGQDSEIVTGNFGATSPQAVAVVTYAPQVFYFRRAIRRSRTFIEAMELGLAVVEELDSLKAWVWDRGLIPPMWRTVPDHLVERGWQNGIPEDLLPEECL
jgi:hypothetical protein